jgi:hypothetical protein
MRRWLSHKSGRGSPTTLFEIRCACGQTTAGQRETEHQILRCAGCGRKLFIFPISPLVTALGGSSASQSLRLLAARLRSRPWLLPVVAAVVTLAVVIVAFIVVLGQLGRPAAPRRDELTGRLAAGRKALAEGNFHAAVEHLKAARELHGANPGLLPASEARHLDQLYRQAALLDDLLSEPLGEIVLKAAGQADAEWQADFDRRYQGKAVVFEAWLRWDAAAGKFQLEYPILAGGEAVRLDWGNFHLFQRVPPLENPQLVLFGARLAGIRRASRGGWVIQFQPDSGVFLTDPGAAGACCPRPLDERLQAALDQQAKWDEAGER